MLTILQAANRNKQLREIILGALESLELEINFAKILIRQYAWDENVRKTTEDLYIAILDAVEAIMTWIEKRKGCEFLFCPFHTCLPLYC